MKRPNTALVLISFCLVAFLPGYFTRLKFHQRKPIEAAKINKEVQIQVLANEKCIAYETDKSICLMDCEPLNNDQKWIIKVQPSKRFKQAYVLIPKSNQKVFFNYVGPVRTEPTLGTFSEEASLFLVEGYDYRGRWAYNIYHLNSNTSLNIQLGAPNYDPPRLYSWGREDAVSFFIETMDYKNEGIRSGVHQENFPIYLNYIEYGAYHIQSFEWNDGIQPCLEYNEKSKLIICAECNPDNYNQKWVFERQSKYNRWKIHSLFKNSDLYISTTFNVSYYSEYGYLVGVKGADFFF